MKNREIISSLFWIGVGIIFDIGAIRYGVVASGIPGAGLLPLIGGSILLALSLMVLISALINKREDSKKMLKEKFFPQHESWKKVLLTVLALFAYWIAIEYLGFLLTTLLFMIFLLRFIEPQGWRITLVTAFLVTISSYALFELWLKVQLPKGIFWI